MVDLDVLIRQSHSLQALPASVTRLASLVASDDWRVDEIEEVVSLDQGLTADLLRVANSAAFGATRGITSVRDAVIRLGAGSVLSLAMAASMHDRLDRPIPQYGLSEGEMWRHSVAAALAAEEATRFCTSSIPAESFTAALLHDVGKLILCRHLDPSTLALLQSARRDDGLSATCAELAILDLHHGELGALAAQHWGLPESIVKGIQYHHDPAAGGASVCDAVCLANRVAHQVLDESPDPEYQLDDSLSEHLGLDAADFESLCEVTGERVGDVLAQYR